MAIINKNNVSTLVEQFNLTHLTTWRAPLIGSGWESIVIDQSFFNESVDQIISLLNIRKAENISKVRYKLRNEPLYAWYGERLHWSGTRQKWVYTAGQDYTAEIKSIRLELYK